MRGNDRRGASSLPRAVAVVAIGAAVASAWWLRSPDDGVQRQPASSPREALARGDAAPPATRRPAPTDAAAAKLHELQAMSETFRNTTFLIAIRDAGFVCRELLHVYGGVNSSATWTASCSDMLAYTVRVAASGALAVEPMLQYLDARPGVPPVDPPLRERLPPLEPRR